MKLDANYKCGEIYRYATGTFLFSCAYCETGVFSIIKEIVDHIESHFLTAAAKPNLNKQPKTNNGKALKNDLSNIDNGNTYDINSKEAITDFDVPVGIDEIDKKEKEHCSPTSPKTNTNNNFDLPLKKDKSKKGIKNVKTSCPGSVPKACPICGKVVRYDSYKNHMQGQHPDGTLNFICDICGKSFKVKKFLRCHMYERHSNAKIKRVLNRKLLICEKCGKICNNAAALYWHRQIHCSDSPTTIDTKSEKEKNDTSYIICSICNEEFVNSISFIKHVHEVHKRHS